MLKTLKAGLVRHLALPFFLATTSLAISQTTSAPQREVSVVALNLHAPIQVVSILDGKIELTLPRGMNQVVSFQDAGANWIGNVSYRVENHSSKAITAVEARISVSSWESDPRRPHKFVRFHEGQLPQHALRDGNNIPLEEDSSLTLDLAPGKTVDIPLSRAAVKLIMMFPSEKVTLASATSIWIQVERVFFADGTVWAFNQYLRPDADAPGKYVPVTPAEWQSQH